MNGERIPCALIGAGGMGARWAHALSSHPQMQIVAIVDTDKDRADALANRYAIPSQYTSIEEALARSDIAACIIVLPHFLLSSVSATCLRAGKHVLVEKPGAIHSKDIAENIRLAEAKNLQYMVGFNHRFHPSHQKAKEVVESGAIGEILFLRARYGFGGRPGYENEWRHKKEVSGGGELIDQGIHLIDLARWFLGDIIESKGFLENAFWHSEVEDNAFLLLKNKRGKVASLHASWSHWKAMYSLEIMGSMGYCTIEGLGKKYGGTERVYIGKRSADFGVDAEEMIECSTDADDSLRRIAGSFADAIRGVSHSGPSGRDGHEALSIVESIYKQNTL